MTEDEHRQLDAEVAACAAAHQRLHASLQSSANDGLDPLRPSLLPDWTVGHVLTHIARNADGLRNMIEGANLGEQRPMYPSQESRNAHIDAGATRPLDVLIDDVRRSSWAVESAWAALTQVGWEGAGITRAGATPVRVLPLFRWREVEVHHADLGLSEYSAADWSPALIAADLPLRLADRGAELPPEVVAAQPWQQLAWLYGRASGLTTPTPQWL
jgi:maleylpyruvate isomerase